MFRRVSTFPLFILFRCHNCSLLVCTEKGNIRKTGLPQFLTEINEQRYSHSTTNISIYPNPTTNTITVQTLTDTPYTYLIINQLGETVQSGKVDESTFSHQISVNTLSSGAYIFVSQRSRIITKQIFSVIK